MQRQTFGGYYICESKQSVNGFHQGSNFAPFFFGRFQSLFPYCQRSTFTAARWERRERCNFSGSGAWCLLERSHVAYLTGLIPPGSVCKLRSDWLVPFHIQCPETKHPPCAYRDRYEGQCLLLVLQPSAVLKQSQQCCDESTDKVVGNIAAFFLSIKRRPSIRFQGRWRNWRTPDDIFVSVELDASPHNSMLFILVTLPLARNVVVKWQKASGTLHMNRSFCTSTIDFGTA